MLFQCNLKRLSQLGKVLLKDIDFLGGYLCDFIKSEDGELRVSSSLHLFGFVKVCLYRASLLESLQ